MKKSWGLTEKILSGEKRIESRWYVNRSHPWGMIAKGDTVYFKNSGEPITIRAKVAGIKQFEGLTPRKVKTILKEYGEADGIEKKVISRFFTLFKAKKYCLLVFLKNPKSVAPFHIDKSGFGAMAAWLVVPSIAKIRV